MRRCRPSCSGSSIPRRRSQPVHVAWKAWLMASPRRYGAALEAAGFEEIALVNRNSWYLGLARLELLRLTGSARANFEKFLGIEGVKEMIETWQAMVLVLESAEHCPHHIRAIKPV